MRPNMQARLRVEKTTKNCIMFVELDDDGQPRDSKDPEVVINRACLYVTKAAMKKAGFKKVPKEMIITFDY